MLSEDDIVGYTVAYEREEIFFPVYVVTFVAVALMALGLIKDLPILYALAVVPAGAAYYNLPLLETGRPRIGAGQYGLFIEGLGLVSWRSIDAIEIAETMQRGDVTRDLAIALKQPIPEALLADWRRRPIARKLMRLPWKKASKTAIRIPLDILDRPAEEIHATLLRMWRYYRGR